MDCTKTQDLLSAYYDNELSEDLRASVGEHLADCVHCAAQLGEFQKLSLLASSFDLPESPHSVWSGVREQLDGEADQEVVSPAETLSGHGTARKLLLEATALAATLLIAIIGIQVWFGGDHGHEDMVRAIEAVAANLDDDETTSLLLNKYGGSVVTADAAITQVGYQPIASRSLPDGYSVENIQVLNMPCCKCTQTACQRPDNTRFFIYEHEIEETGWFKHRNKRQTVCSGKTCQLVDLDNQLAVTWQKDNRHITLLGIRDEEELELLVSQFENKL